ncbi:alpha/beta hydrolase [Brevundimonas bacteroides]|uniref:alpha/beta hydrolase n=1 Tax=Brevundimonas bacteroides TaxID=74311 RepID=UPI000496AB28|nr:alpha/beta hydrolase [Brevundimonas bacteroides]
MVPIFVFAILLNLASLAILGTGAWLGWSWYAGDLVQTPTGVERIREDWRLWASLGLLAFSVFGRALVLPLLARRDAGPVPDLRREGVNLPVVDGASLYVEKIGSGPGPMLLFTHGWGLDSTVWNDARQALKNEHAILSWDLPGLGRSKSAGPQGVSLEAFAANLRHLVLGTGRPVILIGHSIGGMTIQTLARDHPELFGREVVGVVLLNTTDINPLRTMIWSPLFQALRIPVLIPLMWLVIVLEPLAWLSAWQSYLSGMAHLAQRMGFGPEVTRAQLDLVARLATRNRPGVQARGNLAMFEWDARDALSRLPIPTLVIGGQRDIVTKPEAGRCIAASVPGARFEEVRKANHMGFLEQGDIYTSEIRRFAQSLRSDPRVTGS